MAANSNELKRLIALLDYFPAELDFKYRKAKIKELEHSGALGFRWFAWPLDAKSKAQGLGWQETTIDMDIYDAYLLGNLISLRERAQQATSLDVLIEYERSANETLSDRFDYLQFLGQMVAEFNKGQIEPEFKELYEVTKLNFPEFFYHFNNAQHMLFAFTKSGEESINPSDLANEKE
jgi:hypothetical protein